ncbi:hypothetical protein ACJ41O_010782 [Fusarium nematophilum]
MADTWAFGRFAMYAFQPRVLVPALVVALAATRIEAGLCRPGSSSTLLPDTTSDVITISSDTPDGTTSSGTTAVEVTTTSTIPTISSSIADVSTFTTAVQWTITPSTTDASTIVTVLSTSTAPTTSTLAFTTSASPRSTTSSCPDRPYRCQPKDPPPADAWCATGSPQGFVSLGSSVAWTLEQCAATCDTTPECRGFYYRTTITSFNCVAFKGLTGPEPNWQSVPGTTVIYFQPECFECAETEPVLPLEGCAIKSPVPEGRACGKVGRFPAVIFPPLGGYNTATIDDCAEFCAVTTGCDAFEYTNSLCKLWKNTGAFVEGPSQGPRDKVYTFWAPDCFTCRFPEMFPRLYGGKY